MSFEIPKVRKNEVLSTSCAAQVRSPFGVQPFIAEGTNTSKGETVAVKNFGEAELQRCERDNLVQVLEAANWKISGPDGAAELLGVKPTTLLSRMDKWGLKKPER
jgi:transcriptional regulator with GAF, ATPase, and Fis domain